jgi:hypothetical protein
LKDMGIPDREIDAFIIEYENAKNWREWEIQKHKEAFTMETKIV